MARKYEVIWKAIKSVKVGQVVPVRCHESAARTLKQGVKKVKTEEVADKKRLGMPAAGNLKITQEPDATRPGFVIINFSLEWDGEKL